MKKSDLHLTDKETKGQKSQFTCSEWQNQDKSPRRLQSLWLFPLHKVLIAYKSHDGPGDFTYSEEPLLQIWNHSH